MTIESRREELRAAVGTVGIGEAITEGYFDALVSPEGGTPVQSGALHIVHKGSMATYTPVATDNGAYMVFDYAGDMVITLPSAIVAQEDDPFTMFAVNTLGRIDFVSQTPFIGYAPHVAQNVTCGLIRGSVNWYASGTNNKEELS